MKMLESLFGDTVDPDGTPPAMVSKSSFDISIFELHQIFLLQAKYPAVTTFFDLFGASRSYFPQHPCHTGPIASSLGYRESTCEIRPSPVLKSWNFQ